MRDLAARRSERRRSKIVMRFSCCLVAFSLACSCLMVPRAKAFAFSTSAIGSLFGSVLGSYGFTWAADNVDQQAFGDAVYREIQNWKEETTSDSAAAIDALVNLVGGGIQANGPGHLLLNQKVVQAISSFAEWFVVKNDLLNSSSACIISSQTVTDDSGIVYELTMSDIFEKPYYVYPFSVGSIIYDITHDSDLKTIYFGSLAVSLSVEGKGFYVRTSPDAYTSVLVSSYDYVSFVCDDTYLYACIRNIANPSKWRLSHKLVSLSELDVIDSSLSINGQLSNPATDISEDQSLDIAVPGVTALDIEGIIQGAVDQILAGIYAPTAEVVEAIDQPVPGEVVDVDSLGLPALGAALTTRFPFSIPWDIARGITLLAAPPKTPHFEVDFYEPISGLVGGWKGNTKIVLDFSQFEILGSLSRWTSTIGFCLFLASATKRFIWTA